MYESVEFCQYLEETGVMTALTKSFLKLYEKNPRPENAVPFFQKHLNEQFPTMEEYQKLLAKLNRYETKLEAYTSKKKEEQKPDPYKKKEEQKSNPNALADPNVQRDPICLHCRDFSGVDKHAREIKDVSVTSLEKLAAQLCSSFNLKVEKARAIFTWISDQIEYDTEAFLAQKIPDQSPQAILISKTAVCEGYASLFEELAKLANLDVKLITGHGKGYGYVPDPMKFFEQDHAWNAVQLDNEEWQLVDSCWGAGQIDGSQKFKKKFTPTHFTSSSKTFGKKHHPKEKNNQFCNPPLTWEEYIAEETPTLFGSFYDTSFSEETIEPTKKNLKLGLNKFVIRSKCEHTKIRSEDRYLILLLTEKRDANLDANTLNEEIFNVDSDGTIWTCEANVVENSVYRAAFVSKYGGVDGKGLKVEIFKAKTQSFEIIGIIEWIQPDICLHCHEFEKGVNTLEALAM